MDHDHFVQQVQHRARLASNGEAIAAIRSTLETLAERLAGGETEDLAAQLPQEIGYYLRSSDEKWDGERFDVAEFFRRVSERERAGLPDAVFHARAVMSVLDEAVSPGEMEDVRDQLPDDYSLLFEKVTS